MGRRLRGSAPWPLDIDLAFDPHEERDLHGRWTAGELHALDTWVAKRGGVRRIQHGDLNEDFSSALAKLPESTGDLYRGVKGVGAERHANLNVGDTVHWDEPRSASTDLKQAFAFGTNLYRIQDSHGRVVAGEGLPNAYEKEAILPPGDYEVASRDDTAKVRANRKLWPVSIVTLRPKSTGLDLAFDPTEPRDAEGRWDDPLLDGGDKHMLVRELLKAQSYEGQSYIGHGATVQDRIDQIKKAENESGDGGAWIRAHWDEIKDKPIRVLSNGWVADGHHRIMVAQERGVRTLPITDKKYDTDLANPATRPTVVVATRRTKVDEDGVVRQIAVLLRTGARFKRLSGDFALEVDGITKLLAPWGIRSEAVRMALGLTHKEGGGRRGTAHSPNARLAEAGVDLDDQIRDVRDADVYFRAAYLANAALRMQATMSDGGTQRDALRRERTYYLMHEEARRGRLKAVAQVRGAAEWYGPLVGWYLNPLKKNEAECIAANGHNFYAEQGTVIGLPGSVHNRCGCYAGPPWEGAGMVDDVFSNLRLLRPTGSTAKFKLKESRTA